MAWRIKWRLADVERMYALLRERVAIWVDEDGGVTLEAPPDGWQWATLVESPEDGAIIRWHHSPKGVVLWRDGKPATVEAGGTDEWALCGGDELRFEDGATIEILATSSSIVGRVEFFGGESGQMKVNDATAQAMWRLHRRLATGGGWQEVLRAIGDEAREQLGMEDVEGAGVLIWEGEEEFYHRVIWSEQEGDAEDRDGGPRRPGALASLLTREQELKVALEERGEAVLRWQTDQNIDLLLPIHDDEFLGAFYLIGSAGADFDAQQIRSLAELFNPVGVGLVQRYRTRQKVRNFEEENRYFRERERRHYLFKDLVCESKVMRQVYDELHERVEGREPILMTGEAGTGKELLARALHHLGDRQEGMLIRMGCADFPRELVGFELFGCVASELTGAVAARKGIFELAEGGTVFLDEVDRLSPMVQGKLVRVLKEREVRRIGDAVGRPVDARFIASSHRDLEMLCNRGSFRPDLYELLVPHSMTVPPLRRRKADILPLARIFLKKFVARYDANCRAMGEELKKWLVDYPWPGNVRQLQTFLEAAVLMAREEEIINREHLVLGKLEVCVSE